VATTKTLDEALKEILRDDGKVSKYEARAIKELIMADGKMSTDEKAFLEKAVRDNVLDEDAYKILHELLMREEMKGRT
jgi:peptide subunit release factor 1 (eRF1)